MISRIVVSLFSVFCAAPLCAKDWTTMPQYAKNPTIIGAHWHLLVKSRGGTVSLIKNLTQNECEFSRARLLGLPATEAEKDEEEKKQAEISRECQDNPKGIICGGAIAASEFYMSRPGDIEKAECFE